MELAAARERGARVVTLAHRDFDAAYVGVDNSAAAYDVTDYVISLGHRRIAFVEGPPRACTRARSGTPASAPR